MCCIQKVVNKKRGLMKTISVGFGKFKPQYHVCMRNFCCIDFVMMKYCTYYKNK